MVFGFKRKQKQIDVDALKEEIITCLKGIYDPEIPVNIYDLGLIYDVIPNEKGEVQVKMTLTTPACPVAQTFPFTIEQEVLKIKSVVDCNVEVVWDPPWTPDCMSRAAKLELGLL